MLSNIAVTELLLFLLYDLFAVIGFAATIGEQAITSGPQVFVFNCLCVDVVQVAFVQSFDNFCGDASYQGERRNDGAFGYYCACSNNGATTYYCAVQNSCVHTDKAVVFYGASMKQCAVTNGYKVTNYASVFICYVKNCVVLDISVTTNFDTVNVTTNSYVRPNTAVLFHFYHADYGGGGKCVSFFVDFRLFTFKFKNHISHHFLRCFVMLLLI